MCYEQVDFEPILQATLSLLVGSGFDDISDQVLIFLRKFCILNGKPVVENQNKILEAIVAFTHATDAGGSGSHSYGVKTQIFFRRKGDLLEVSASTGLKSKVWRSLKMFWSYEPRAEVRNFLAETLRLWACLAEGNNRLAVNQFRQHLSFVQIMEALMWRNEPSPNPKLTEPATLFCELMLHLYVNTSPEEVQSSGKTSLVKRVAPVGNYLVLRAPQIPGQLKFREATQLKFFVNDFVVGGRMLCETDPGLLHNDEDLVAVLSRPTDHGPKTWGLVKAMLSLAKYLVLYGYYSNPQDSLELQLALIYALSRSKTSKTEAAAVVEVKLLIIEVLELLLEVRLDIRLNELVQFSLNIFKRLNPAERNLEEALKAKELLNNDGEIVDTIAKVSVGSRVQISISGRSSFQPAYRLGTVLAIQEATSTVSVRWDATNPMQGLDRPLSVRAGEMGSPLTLPTEIKIGSPNAPQLKVVSLATLRELFATEDDLYGEGANRHRLQLLKLQVIDTIITDIGVNGKRELAMAAYRFMFKTHNQLHMLASKVRSLLILETSQEQTYQNLLTVLEELQKVSLSASMGLQRSGRIERALQVISTTLFARVGARVVRGPDWPTEAGQEDGQELGGITPAYGRITDIREFNNVPNAGVVVTWEKGSAGKLYRFGYEGNFDVRVDVAGFISEESEAQPIAQYMARILGLHRSLFNVIGQESQVTASSLEVDNIMKGCYEALRSFTLGNSINKGVVTDSHYIDLMLTQKQASYGAVDLFTEILKSPETANSVSLRLVSFLVEAIHEKLEAGEKRDAGTRYMRLLSMLVPESSSAENASPDSSPTSSLVLSLMVMPGNYSKTTIAQQILDADAGDPGSFDNFDGMLHLQSELAVVLSKGCNTVVKDKILALPCLSMGRLMLKILDLQQQYFGSTQRPQVLFPWLNLLNQALSSHNELTTSAQSVAAAGLDRLALLTAKDMQLYSEVALWARTAGKQQGQRAKTVTIESRHPYDNNTDQYWEVEVPGASRVKVAFANETRTERNYDFVQIYRAQPRTMEGYLKYRVRSGFQVSVRRKFAAESAEVANLDEGTLLMVGRREWIPATASSEAGGGHYEAQIIHPVQFATCWVSMKRLWAFVMCDTDGDPWETT
jgi:hypothetical protein